MPAGGSPLSQRRQPTREGARTPSGADDLVRLLCPDPPTGAGLATPTASTLRQVRLAPAFRQHRRAGRCLVYRPVACMSSAADHFVTLPTGKNFCNRKQSPASVETCQRGCVFWCQCPSVASSVSGDLAALRARLKTPNRPLTNDVDVDIRTVFSSQQVRQPSLMATRSCLLSLVRSISARPSHCAHDIEGLRRHGGSVNPFGCDDDDPSAQRRAGAVMAASS